MSEHPYGWLSLLPPAVAIVLAIMTRRVLLSLLVGIFFGSLVVSDWRPVDAASLALDQHLLPKLLDQGTLQIFLFTLIMGAMVGVINRSGGMRGLVNAVTPLASNQRRGQLTTWLLGLFVFFDDYANTVLLGNTLRPLTDKLRISREKLAYIVDSTAAPVAGLALISTWVAAEIEYVELGIKKLPGENDVTALELFVASIPYRFYVLWALLFVPIIAILGRDFGPMLKAERRSGDATDTLEETNEDFKALPDPTGPEPETQSRWFNAVVPILVTVLAVLWFLYQSGAPDGDKSFMNVFGDADAYSSLLWGALAGFVTAVVLILPQRIISGIEMGRAAGQGMLLMLPALAILWLAQTLSSLTGNGPSPESHEDVAKWMAISGATNAQMVEELKDQPIPSVIAALTGKDHAAYQWEVKNTSKKESERGQKDDSPWESFATELKTTQLFLSQENIGDNLAKAGYKQADIDFVLEYSEYGVHQFQSITANEDERLVIEASFPIVRFTNRQTYLYTGTFLSAQLQQLRDRGGLFARYFTQLLPTFVFLIAGFVAFSTGTSWGTMGIVMPLVIPLAYAQISAGSTDVDLYAPVMLCCIGSVLAGAIFGDHCSPISDTTVLSSQASGCNHIAHVRTQLPYAMLVAAASVLFGTLPIGFGVPVWILLPIGLVMLLVFLLIFGKRSSSPD